MVTNYIEVFVDTPLEICEERDVKGMYAKARAALIKDFTGVDDPYERPENSEIIIFTEGSMEKECKKLVKYLVEGSFVPHNYL